MASRVLGLLLFTHFVLASSVKGSSEPWLKVEKSAELGTEVQLPCRLKLPQCVGLHSIKWYRGNTRIFVYSEDVGVTRIDTEMDPGAGMMIAKNDTETFLKIPNIKIADEGLYKCEATYLAVNRECNNVQHITLNVTVQPVYVRVIDEDTKATLETGKVLGPINDGTKISLRCESSEGRPVPIVEWYNGDKLLESESTSQVEENGIGTGSSLLNLQVTRSELGANLTCKISSSLTLAEPLTIDIRLDVHVAPLTMNIRNNKRGQAIRGSQVLLECSVGAARPAANVTWFNGTTPVKNDSKRLDMLETKILESPDGTAETKSYFIFTVTEYDSGIPFSCQAENSVMQKEGTKPLKETTTIEVLYEPLITLKPNNITVNETEQFTMLCEYVANPATLTSVKWLRDGEEIALDPLIYEGGSIQKTDLTIKNSTSEHMGNYTCVLENTVGKGNTSDFVVVSVLYKPEVEVSMEPSGPINETDRVNVSLTCEVTDGNPRTLIAVRWYLDGDLLKELPDCTRNTTPVTTDEIATFCDIDPSKLLLEAVGRSFHGNYSCEGRNEAGWGPISSSTPVVVNYKPGPASISYEPLRVIKKHSLTITCSVEDPGRPEIAGFKWMRGLYRLPDENKSVLKIESANLETEANFTCMAYNSAGDGDSATTFVDVQAPPAFIKKLPPYVGFAYNASSVSIECIVECAPICNISWKKGDKLIDFSESKQYYVNNFYRSPDLRTFDFESIQSTLIWNLTAWPNGQLDRLEDNGRFTCESTSNGVGKAVNSNTTFQVEYPPENLTISRERINVIVDHIPEKISCSAKAYPEPQFEWYREGSNEILGTSNTLSFEYTFPKRSNGTYYCRVKNRQGVNNISTYINVQYKPECRIERERRDGQDYIVCSAEGNPKESDFTWTLKVGNDTFDQNAEIHEGKSYILLEDLNKFRTYICVANNSIGFSNECELDVPGSTPWWLRILEMPTLAIIVAVVVLIAIIIAGTVIFIVCRRKRTPGKYPNQTTNSNHMGSLSEGMTDPDTKTFYENLPFHGIQTPPNKLVSPKFAQVSALHGTLHSTTTSPCSSRPLSRTTSLCGGSSGYESTRSHLGPHYSIHNMPRSNSPELKYNTLKPRRRKHRHSQFYSLRLCRKHEASAVNRNFQLYAIPIYKSCPHKTGSTSTIATSIRSNECTPTSTLTRSSRETIKSEIIKTETIKKTETIESTSSSSSTLHSTNSQRIHSKRNNKINFIPSDEGVNFEITKIDDRNKIDDDVIQSSELNSKRIDKQLIGGEKRSKCGKKEILRIKKEEKAKILTMTTATAIATATRITPPVPAPRTRKTNPIEHTYQNIPPPVFPEKSATACKLKTNNSICDYKEHYQQHQQQEMQQYGYPMPSNSSSQLTLPIARSLYHSSVVSPLQTSYVQTNNRHSLMHPDGSASVPLSLVHGDDLDLTYDRQLTNSSSTGRRNDRRKYRKHGRGDRKQKRRGDSRRAANENHSETSFNRVQELGIPESYKISYPHYYEDAITECPPDYPRPNLITQQSQRDFDVNRYPGNGGTGNMHYADLSLTKNRNKATKRYSTSTRDARSPSMPSITQYAELNLRDVGQEIDV
ncbi:hemicentin-1 isoform X4 [Leptopilina heterotoma]|uniref:hemicentin-1 isoform X4 n=1 Tax=Leptopilina heterotoma TaxID=63436 RepID=UPI001CA8A42E|nr:hemicentin-1 isoform X4 [Leptopilina heterotoma]